MQPELANPGPARVRPDDGALPVNGVRQGVELGAQGVVDHVERMGPQRPVVVLRAARCGVRCGRFARLARRGQRGERQYEQSGDGDGQAAHEGAMLNVPVHLRPPLRYPGERK